MEEKESVENSLQKNWLVDWPDGLELVNCGWCDWVFLRPFNHTNDHCPHCGSTQVAQIDAAKNTLIYTQPPELVVPFTVDRGRIESALITFAQKTWFAPHDLRAANLMGRLQRVYLPMWLVDTAVQAQWEAEVGFNYDVVSHREQYKNGQWHTQRYTETKVRWELRVGMLKRQYENVSAPALEEQTRIEFSLGKVAEGERRPCQTEDLQDIIIRLPNRSPEDAWTDAKQSLRNMAAGECHRATQADHMRSYRWSPGFQGQHWTQLLYPLYVTYYQDDESQVQLVFLHGNTGKLAGARRASMKRAKRWSLAFGGVAAVIFVIGLLLLLLGTVWQPELLSLGSTALNIALLIGLAALGPVVSILYVNYFQYRTAAQHLRKGILHAGYRDPIPPQVSGEKRRTVRSP